MNYQPDLWMTGLRLGLALGLVLLLCWVAMVLGRRFLMKTPAGDGGRLVQVLGHQYLGMKRTITMVKIPGAVLVLGVTADRIQLLSRIDDPDQLATFERVGPAPRQHRFADHLARLTGARKAAASGTVVSNGLNGDSHD
jgi:flagellar biogenesis protein FliO